MSLKSWKEQFYPLEAQNCSRDNESMLLHSLRKWRGALLLNLEEHDLIFDGKGRICEKGRELLSFAFTCMTCALCVAYFEEVMETEDGDVMPPPDCGKCPLAELQGGPCCYGTKIYPDPYSQFLEHGDPRPMLEALEKCLEIETRTKGET